MLPSITAVGNISRMELTYTQSGKALMKFQVECSEKNSKGEYENLYLKGECWDKSAEFVNQYFNDGSAVIVTGKLVTNIYTNKEGKKIYENKLLFPNVSFIPKDKASNGNQAHPQQQYQPTQHEQQKVNAYQPQRETKAPEAIEVYEDEIPF